MNTMVNIDLFSINRIKIITLITALFPLLISFHANAEGDEWSSEQVYFDIQKKIRKYNEVDTAVRTPVFGDAINLSDGSLSIEQVDISLNGNFDIPVEVRRKYSAASRTRRFEGRDFGDWILNIPRITAHAKMSNGHLANSWNAGSECSSYGNEQSENFFYQTTADHPDKTKRDGNPAQLKFNNYRKADWLIVPGKINAPFLVNNGNRYLGKDWIVSCFTRTNGGFLENGNTGEGFRVTSPEGVTYTFSQLRLIKDLRFGKEVTSDFFGMTLWNDWVNHDAKIEMLVTKIEDRLNNTVIYNYNTYGDLESIVASDGRSIEFEYITKNKVRKLGTHHIVTNNAQYLGTDSAIYTPNVYSVESVDYAVRYPLIEQVIVNKGSAEEQRWTYQYSKANNIDEYESLVKAIKPDGKSWDFHLSLDQFVTPYGDNPSIYDSHAMDCDLKQPYASSASEDQSQFLMSKADGFVNDNYIISPYGSKKVFIHNEKLLGQTNIPESWDLYQTSGNVHGTPDPADTEFEWLIGDHTTDTFVLQPRIARCSIVNAVVRQIVTNIDSSSQEQVWKYDYSQNWGKYEGDTSVFFPNGYGSIQSTEMLLTGSIPSNIDTLNFKKTTVIKPDNSKVVSYFDRRYDSPFQDKEFATVYFDVDGITKLKELQFEYVSRDLKGTKKTGCGLENCTAQAEARLFGSGKVLPNSKPLTYEVFNTSKKVKIIYDGVNSNDLYTIDYSNFNTYGLPQQIHSFNSFSNYERYIRKSYIHDTLNWVLNLPNSVEVSDDGVNFKEVTRVSYYSKEHANYPSLPNYHYSYGLATMRNISYTSEGNQKEVKLITDGSGTSDITYVFDDYKRGVAQTIKVPNSDGVGTKNAVRVVNARGLISSVTDFNGATTHYYHDNDDEISAIRFDSDTSYGINWEGVKYEWDTSKTVRTVTNCQLNSSLTCTGTPTSVKTEYYDNLRRLVKTQHTAGEISRYNSIRYNYNNQKLFESYPSLIPNEEKGISTVYDGVGRPLEISKSGLGKTSNNYLAGNKIEVTDPRGYSTINSYLAFGSPAQSSLVEIESPESVTTSIDYNVYGQVLSVTQSGLSKDGNQITQTEYHVYDPNDQSLCLVARKDTGSTAYQFDRLGKLKYEAPIGDIPITSGMECIENPENKTIYTYDKSGETKSINYPDNIGNITYERDKNGNVIKLTSGSVVQQYNYNNKNLLEDEMLLIEQQMPLMLDYSYDSSSHLSHLGYPDGSVVHFKPNGFGEPTEAQMYSGSTVDVSFAKDAVYYINGTLDSFTYGNGVTHKTTLYEDSLLPEKIQDIAPAGSSIPDTIMSLVYDYDNNANVTSINDEQNSSYSLTNLTYDGLNRLKSTSGGSGIGSSTITYDGLGNITSYQSKGRSLSYTYDYTTNRLEKVVGVNGRYGSISYDSRGNIKHNGAYSLSFNAANQLTTAKGNSYLYDGHNRRVKQIDSSGTSYSMYSKNGTLLYREKGATITGDGINYVHLGKKLIAKYGDLTPRTFEESRQHYSPFGETIETSTDDVGYTGHKFDNDLGLSYMQARYYDPVIGRFYSNDPVDAVAHLSNEEGIRGFNRYSYAVNNPYKYTDPDGKAICGGICVIGVGIGVGLLFDAAIEAIRGDDNSTANTTANAATGGAVAATGPFADKPRGGVAGGGPAGSKTSVASKANHAAAQSGAISTSTRNTITKVLRKVPYVGTVIAAAQLGDAIIDRVESEAAAEDTTPEPVEQIEKQL